MKDGAFAPWAATAGQLPGAPIKSVYAGAQKLGFRVGEFAANELVSPTKPTSARTNNRVTIVLFMFLSFLQSSPADSDFCSAFKIVQQLPIVVSNIGAR